MPNERPGDHPLTDLLVHGLPVYGPKADQCIHEMAVLSDGHELDEWWLAEISREEDPAAILRKAEAHLAVIRSRAPERQGDT